MRRRTQLPAAVEDIPVHRADHRPTLVEPQVFARGDTWMALPRVGAVIVPAGRDGRYLKHACAVARSSARLLVVLADGDCRPDAAVTWIEKYRPEIPYLVVDFDRYTRRGRSATQCLDRELRWEKSTAAKRNLGLMLARVMGMDSVLFLDDDVFGLKGASVRLALQEAKRGKWRTAAWSHDDFPDNSTVCHAYRLLDDPPYGDQTSFVGGGGLLVMVDEKTPHFPPGIYNEDWFFILSCLDEGPVAHMGTLRQLPYDPFGNRGRPCREEFGDVMAERLMTARRVAPGRYRALLAGDPAEWRAAQTDRRTFLREIEAQLPRSRARNRVLSALDALDRIQDRSYVSAARAWRQDAKTWRKDWSALGSPAPMARFRDEADFRARTQRALRRVRIEGITEMRWQRPAAVRHLVSEQIRAHVPSLLKVTLRWRSESVHARRPTAPPSVLGAAQLVRYVTGRRPAH